jgi:hypothetical protein
MTLSDEAIPCLLYYLSCIASATTRPVLSRLTNHEHSECCSVDDLSTLLTLVLGLSPEMLITAHVFISDAGHFICTSLSPLFFEITDRKVASKAYSETVIIVERVVATKIMMCTPESINTNHSQPIRISIKANAHLTRHSFRLLSFEIGSSHCE